jgi:hypothetical protein
MPVASFQNRYAIFGDMLHLYHPSRMSKTDLVSEIFDFYSKLMYLVAQEKFITN